MIWVQSLSVAKLRGQTDATNVSMRPFMQAIWGNIWQHTVEKNHANAASVTLFALTQVLWGDIWRGTDQYRKGKVTIYHCEQSEDSHKNIKTLRLGFKIDEINTNSFTFETETIVEDKHIKRTKSPTIIIIIEQDQQKMVSEGGLLAVGWQSLTL